MWYAKSIPGNSTESVNTATAQSGASVSSHCASQQEVQKYKSGLYCAKNLCLHLNFLIPRLPLATVLMHYLIVSPVYSRLVNHCSSHTSEKNVKRVAKILHEI